jgi:hypothetical protein
VLFIESLFSAALGCFLGTRYRVFALAATMVVVVASAIACGVAAKWAASGTALATLINLVVLQIAYCGGMAFRSWSFRGRNTGDAARRIAANIA